MPLSQDELQLFDPDQLEAEEVLAPGLESSVESASYLNPDKHAGHLALAKDQDLPVEVVQDQEQEVLRRKSLPKIDPMDLRDKYPELSKYLEKPDNAVVSQDDFENLMEVEKTVAATGVDRTWLEFGQDTALDLGKGVVGLGEATVGLANMVTFGAIGIVMEEAGYDPKRTNKLLGEQYSLSRKQANKEVAKAKGFVNTLVSLIENPSAALGTIVESTPLMIGSVAAARTLAMRLLAKEGIVLGTPAARAFLSQPHVVSRLTTASVGAEGAMAAGSIMEGARQGGRTWSESVLPAIAGGTLTGVIGKIGAKYLPDVEVAAAVGTLGRAADRATVLAVGKKIGAGFLKEGVLEELPQSTQEQIFSNLAQGKPWDEGIGEAAAQGLVAGSGMGGGMATVTATMEAVSVQANKDFRTTQVSMSHQQTIDKVIELAQASKTNERAPDQYAELMQAVGAGRALYVDSEIIENMEDAPDFLVERIDELGGDIAIPLEEFTSTVIKNETWLAELRPHLKLHPEGLSQKALSDPDNVVLTNLIKKAAKEKEIKAEADEIYEKVKDQIVGTGRQSEATARFSAQLIPAYVTVKAKMYGVSPQQIFEDMGLTIVGPEGVAPKEGEVIVDEAEQAAAEAEPPPEPRPTVTQDFGDLQVSEDVIVEETGERRMVQEEVQKLWDNTQDRRDRVQKVLECVNA